MAANTSYPSDVKGVEDTVLTDATPIPAANSPSDEKASPPSAAPTPSANTQPNISLSPAQVALLSEIEKERTRFRPADALARCLPARFAHHAGDIVSVLALALGFLWVLYTQVNCIKAGIFVLRWLYPRDPRLVVPERTATLLGAVGGTLSAPLFLKATKRRLTEGRAPGEPSYPGHDTVRGRFVEAAKHDAKYLFLQALVTGLAGSIVLLPFESAGALSPAHAVAASLAGAVVTCPFLLLAISM